MDRMEKDKFQAIEKIVRARKSYINFVKTELVLLILSFAQVSVFNLNPFIVMAVLFLPLFYAIINKIFSSPPCPFCGQPNCLFRAGSKMAAKDCTNCGAKLVELLASNEQAELIRANITGEPITSEPSIIKKAFKILGIISISIVIGIVIHVSVRYGSDYVYSKFRSEGLTPELPYAKEQGGKIAPVDVYLIPFDGFPEPIADKLANILSQELGIHIKAMLSVPIGHHAVFNEKRKQYVAESLTEPIVNVMKQLHDKQDKTAYIALLNNDMCPNDSGLNYVFSSHFTGRVSIIATGRLMPYGVLDKNKAAKIYGLRLLKLVKRTIGQQYFGLPRSDRKDSLMFSPLMSTDDLDRISSNFDTKNKGN